MKIINYTIDDKDKTEGLEYKFIIDDIFLVCIKQVSESTFLMLFESKNHIEENDSLFLAVYINCEGKEINYINNNRYNIINISRDINLRSRYKEIMNRFDIKELWITSFNMNRDEENKSIYKSSALRKYCTSEGEKKYDVANLYINRDIFIKLSLFFKEFLYFASANVDNIEPELVFVNPELQNIKYIYPDSIKLDASSETVIVDTIFNHYTAKFGPNEYKFNFLSPKINDNNYKLINSLVYDLYAPAYGKDQYIDKYFYDASSDSVFILYNEYYVSTGKLKNTLALVFPKELYNHTNFVDLFKIYEKK